MFRNTTDTCIYNHLIQRGENVLKDNSEKYHSYVDQQEVLRLQLIWVNDDYKFLKSWLNIACEDSLMMKSDHGDLVSHYNVLLQNNLVNEILDYGEARETLQLVFIALMSQCKDLKSCLDAANENMISLKSACSNSSGRNEVSSNNASTAEFLDYSRQRETLHLKCVEAIDECDRLNKRLTEAHETIALLNLKHVDLASRFQVISTNEMVKEFFDYAKDQEKLQPNVTEKIEEDEYTKSCIEQANENTKLLNLQLIEVKETLLKERLRFEKIMDEKQSLSHLSDQLRCLLSKYEATVNEETGEASLLTDESAQNSANIYEESVSSSVSEINTVETKTDTENANHCTNSILNQHSNTAEKNNCQIDDANKNGEPDSSNFSDLTNVESQIDIKEEDLCDDSSQDRQLLIPGENNNCVIEVKDEITNECTEASNVDFVVQDACTVKSGETDSIPKTALKLDNGTSTNLCCGVCDRLFSTSSNLEQHMNSHKKSVDNSQNKKEDECSPETSVLEDAPLFNCTNCDKKYRNERDLSGHLRTHPSSSEQFSKNCDSEHPKSPTDNSLINERKSVSKPAILEDVRDFSCTQCDKKYPNESCLSDHMKMHKNSSKHAVKSQDKNNRERKCESKNTGIRRDFSCPRCDEKFSNKSDLSDHEETHKSSSKQNANNSINKKKRKRIYESDDSEDQNFSCTRCDKNYPNESDLSCHMKTHKNNSVQSTDRSHNEKKRKRICEPKNPRDFSGTQCDKKYPKERDLSEQMKKHTNSSKQNTDKSRYEKERKQIREPEDPKDSRDFSCTRCDEKCSNESDLSEHMKRHTNSSVQSTDICNNERKIKCKSKPEDYKSPCTFSCAHCDKKYSKESDLSEHMKKHTNSSKQRMDKSHHEKKRKRVNEPENREDPRHNSSAHSDEKTPTTKKRSNLTAPSSSTLKQHSENSHNDKKKRSLSKTKDPEVSNSNHSTHSGEKNPIKKKLSNLAAPSAKSPRLHSEKSLGNSMKEKPSSKAKDSEVSGSSSSAHSDEKNPTKKKLSNLTAPPASSLKQHSENSHNDKKKRSSSKTKDTEVSNSNPSTHSGEKNPTKKKLSNLTAPPAKSPRLNFESSHSNNMKKKPLSKAKDPEVSSSSSSAHSDERNPTKKKLSNLTTPSTKRPKQNSENLHDNKKKKTLSKPKDPECSRNNSSTHSDGKNPLKKDLSDVKKPSTNASQQHAKKLPDEKVKKSISKPKDPEGAHNFSCDQCDKKYPKESDLSDHMKTHRKNSVKQRSDDSFNPRKRKRISEQEDCSSKKLAKNVHNEEKKKPVSKPKDAEVSNSSSSPHCDMENSIKKDLSDLTTSTTSNPKQRAKNSNDNKKKKSICKRKNPTEIPGKSSSAHCDEKNLIKSEISDLMESSTSRPQQHAENSCNNGRKTSKSEPKDTEVPVDRFSGRSDKDNPINKDLSNPAAPSTRGSKQRTGNSQTAIKNKKKKPVLSKPKDPEVASGTSSAHSNEKNPVKGDLSDLTVPPVSGPKQRTDTSLNKKKKKPICKSKNSEVTSNNSSAHRGEENLIKSELSDIIEPSTGCPPQHEENSHNNKEQKSTDQPKNAETSPNNSSEHADEKNPTKSELSETTVPSTSGLQQQSNQSLSKTKQKKTLKSQGHERYHLFHCAHCEKTYEGKGALASHMKRHMSNPREQIQNLHFIKKEIKQNAEIEVYYNCKHCDKKYRRKKEMVQHVKIHTEPGFEDKLKCNICAKSFASVVSLKYHQAVHTSDKLHKCAFCDSRFKCSSSRIRHENKFHKSENHVYCAHCNKAFNRKFNLEKHIEKKHINFKEIRCDICGKKFSSQYIVIEHKRVVHEKQRPFQCAECGKTYPTMHRLKTHESTHNPLDPSNLDTYCDLCKRHFCSKSVLREHMKLIHDGIKPFKCPCGRQFYKKKDLDHHLTLYDLGNHVKCSFCDKSFHFDVNRIKHEEIHRGIGDGFACAHCDKVYVDKASIARHLRRIHPKLIIEKSFKCTVCGKCFVKKSNFQDHQSKEHNINTARPIKCTLCDDSFRFKSSLSSHMNRKHKGEAKIKPPNTYECKMCPKVFFVKCSLRSHVYVKHRNEKNNISEAKEHDPPAPELTREDARESTEMNISGITEQKPPELSKEGPPELNKEHSPELSKVYPPELIKEASPQPESSRTVVLPLSAY